MKTPVSRACTRPVNIAWVSTYRTVQIRRTTSTRRYPEEITRLTVPLAVTLYFRDLPLLSKSTKGRAKVRHLSAITYKRRGDLESKGFHGELPFGFEFGDSPQTLLAKAGEVPALKTAAIS